MDSIILAPLYPRLYCSWKEPRHFEMKHLQFGSESKGLQQPVSRAFLINPNWLRISSAIINLRPLPNIGYKRRTKRINVESRNAPVSLTIELLDAYEDEYNGVIVNSQGLPTSSTAFAAILQQSLSYWKAKGKKGVWLKLLEEQAELILIALKEGFSYHHADPGYIMLTYWIPDEPCLLPSTATHQIGVGAFVLNGNREVLVVKEKTCPLRCSGIWKLPTGFINKSEEIFSGAMREVKEETGIDTVFQQVLAFRHAHYVTFEKSDLLFICKLKPLSSEIVIDESEIEDAKWMPLDEFLAQPFFHEDDMFRSILDICVSSHEDDYHGFTSQNKMSMFDGRMCYLYRGGPAELPGADK